MESDDLKNAWTALDDRLKKNELLNKRMVQDMLCTKSNKSLNKIANTEVFNVIVLLLAIPLCIWLLNNRFEKFLFPKITFIFGIVVSILGIILSVYTLKCYFMKIDFSKKVNDNIYYMNKYNIFYKKGKKINYFIIIPIFALLGMLSYYELNVPFHLWIFLLVALTIGIAMTFWIYKKYDFNILSIKKNLEELKELELEELEEEK